jgi:hypothetical protein
MSGDTVAALICTDSEAVWATLAEAIDALERNPARLDEAICCSGAMCGCRGSTNRHLLVHDARTAIRTLRAQPSATLGGVTAEQATEARLAMFLEILAASTGRADASDHQWNWINAFCEDHEGRSPDTFNLAEQQGYTTVSHDSDSDQSTVYLTPEGRAYLAALSLQNATPDATRARETGE